METGINKQQMQPAESRESGASPHQTDGNGPHILMIRYNPFMKLVLAIGGLSTVVILYFFLTSEEFVLHLAAVAGVAALLVYLSECLTTRSITLEPERIVKRRLFFGETVIPALKAVLVTDQHSIRFYYGSSSNRRERITILVLMISREEAGEVVEYARKRYQYQLREVHTGEDGAVSLEGGGAGKGRKVSSLILGQFDKARDTYGCAAVVMTACTIVAFLTMGLADSFDGLAPALSADWIRTAAILLAVAAYLPLRRLNSVAAASPDSRNGHTRNQRAESLGKSSLISMLLVSGVAVLGLALFFLFGNLLDFYLFLAVAICYYLDFTPRLSAWEELWHEEKPTRAAGSAVAPTLVPRPSRRRSLQVSLVLLGALAASSYGESQHYLYKSKKDCMDDWGSDQDCQEPGPGSVYHHSGYYYGPRYGSSGRGMRSVGRASVSRGGFGSMGSFHASFGG